MAKRILAFLLLIVTAASAAGCYSYVGLDQMSIVAGVAIDIADGGDFDVAVEVIDISDSSKDTGIKTIIVKAQGRTIFDAVRNARSQMPHKLYFGNNSLVIVSKELAGEHGLLSVIDFFMRNEECRETVHMVVSSKDTAAELLKAKGYLSDVTSYEIQKMIADDIIKVGTVHSPELYKIYNLLLEGRREICLPLITATEKDGQEYVEIDGMAIFKKDKLAGNFNIEESKYCLFVSDDKEGGIITLGTDAEMLSLEIFTNKTEMSFTEHGGEIRFKVKTVTEACLGEKTGSTAPLKQEDVARIRDSAEEKLREKITEIIRKTQTDTLADIYGYSALIYRKNPALWEKIKDDWDNIYPQIPTKVECEIKIINTMFTK